MKNLLSILVLVVTTLSFNANIFAQQVQLIDPSMTPRQAVEDVLLGAGINAFNITYNGSASAANNVQNSVKHFTDGGGIFPIAEGVILNTNGAPSVSGDPDLNAIATLGVFNGVVIEFDFVPSGDTLSFDYMFASAEYTGFTCSNYNDVFGFFISGPGISGPYSNSSVNIAIIPGSITPSYPNGIPVGINTVNSGVPSGFGTPTPCVNANPNWISDSQYWTNSYNSAMWSIAGGFNGETVVLAANSNLVCSDTFHIKMALANVGDANASYGSGVFLSANSFASEGVEISIVANATVLDTLLIEGCTEGTVYFSRPASQAGDTLVIHFQAGGSATQGDDYPPLASGDSIVLLPGQTIDSLVISPFQDGIDEGMEQVEITAYTVNECGDTVVAQGTIWIDDEPHSIVHSTDTTVLCSSDSIPLWASTEDITHFVPYTYTWYEIGTNDTVAGNPLQGEAYGRDTVVQYLVTSTDACGFQYSDTASITLHQTLNIDSLNQYIATCGENDGAVVGFGSGFTGTPDYTWSGPGADSTADSTSASAWSNLSPGWYYFSIQDDVCKTNDSIQVEQTPPPEASFEATPESGMSPLDVVFDNTSDDATTYIWDFGNGEDVTLSDKDDQSSTYIEEGVYTVTLILQEGSCTNQATKEITVILPAIYDMPNVFTPNGDGDNDYFTINAENMSSIEFVLLNRWGNVIFESNDVNFKWYGKTKSGQKVDDGTYFYKFTFTNHAGTEKSEHGFVHVLSGK